MTRSIFDPTGGESEQSGSRSLGPLAENNSHMPLDVIDGKVSEEESAEHENLAAGDGVEQLQSAMPNAALGTQNDDQRQAPPAS